jgi:hypothetical protein
MVKYLMAIWTILWTFGICYAHLIHFVLIWYIFSSFGIMYKGKSGNPGIEFNATCDKMVFRVSLRDSTFLKYKIASPMKK